MLNKLIEILLSALALAPVFCVLHKNRFQSRRESGLYFLFAVYLAAVYLFVGLPTLQFVRFELSLTLIPFLPMIADFRNTLLNILLFVPLGIFLPLLWRKYRTLKATGLFCFGMSLAIELLQILTYRATDVNDILANTFGAVLGYGLFGIGVRLAPKAGELARERCHVSTIILWVFVIMFFVQPWLAEVYYKVL